MHKGEIAFQNCTTITEAVLPEGLITIGTHAFFGCSNLVKVNIPSTVTYLGHNPFLSTAFYKDKSNWTDDVLYLNNCLLDNSYTSNFEIKEDTRLFAENALSWSRVTSIDLSKFSFNIPAEFLSNSKYLQSIILSKETKSIGIEAF